jgi:hypothetical protein
MKLIRFHVLAAIVAVAAATLVYAAISDVEIHCSPKRVDTSLPKNVGEDRTVSKEHWNYDVTVENKTFKSLTGIEVKYVIFYKTEELGSKAEPKTERVTGSNAIAELRPHEKKSFNTNSAELNKSHLTGHWYYSGGERIKAEDTLSGAWFRVYQNGQQIGEYANPSTLITQQKWE